MLKYRELQGAVFAVSMSRWGTQHVPSLATRFSVNCVLRAFVPACGSSDPRVIHEVRPSALCNAQRRGVIESAALLDWLMPFGSLTLCCRRMTHEMVLYVWICVIACCAGRVLRVPACSEVRRDDV